MDNQGQDPQREELRLIQEKAWSWRQEMDAFGDFEPDVLEKGSGKKRDLMMIPAVSLLSPLRSIHTNMVLYKQLGSRSPSRSAPPRTRSLTKEDN